MPLTQEQEEREYGLRVAKMETNIEKLRSDIRYESRKFVVQAIIAAAALVGAGVAIGNYVARNRPPENPLPPQVIVIPQAPAATPRPL